MMLNEFLKEHRKVEEFNEDKARRAPQFPAEPSCWGLSFYASVIMALLGASERRARFALHEVQVVVPVVQRGFQARLIGTVRIASRRISIRQQRVIRGGHQGINRDEPVT